MVDRDCETGGAGRGCERHASMMISPGLTHLENFSPKGDDCQYVWVQGGVRGTSYSY
jgi:hypothetical protein